MWLIYSITAGILFTISRTIQRYILKGEKDAWAFSFWFSTIGLLVNLPLVIANPNFSNSIIVWAVLILVSLSIVLHNLLSFRALNFISPSLKQAISKARLVWIFLFGIIFLSESFTLEKLIGTLLIILAGLIVIKGYNSKDHILGIAMIFTATIIYAISITAYTGYFSKEFSPEAYSFLIFFFPAVMNFLLMPNSRKRIVSLIKINPYAVISAGVLAGLANYVLVRALNEGEQSKVVIIVEAFLVLLIGFEYLVLKEKENPGLKLLAIILAIFGTILIKLA